MSSTEQISTIEITNEQEISIRDLIEYAEKSDSATACIQMSTELNINKEMPCWFLSYLEGTLVGVCSLFAINTYEAELSLLVHPDHRMKGIGNSLLHAALETVKKHHFSQLLFVCDDHSESGKSYIKKQAFPLDHTEYTLKFDKSTEPLRAKRLLVSRAYEKDLDKIVEINVDAFEDDYEVASQFIQSCLSTPTRTAYLGKLNYKPICTLVLGHEDGVYSINGVAVLKAFQRQGFAKELIQEVLYNIKDHGNDIFIDVDSNNSIAYALYKKIGFNETRVTHYYVQKLI